MRRVVLAAALCTILAAWPSAAGPEFRLSYPNGIPRAEITGENNSLGFAVFLDQKLDAG